MVRIPDDHGLRHKAEASPARNRRRTQTGGLRQAARRRISNGIRTFMARTLAFCEGLGVTVVRATTGNGPAHHLSDFSAMLGSHGSKHGHTKTFCPLAEGQDQEDEQDPDPKQALHSGLGERGCPRAEVLTPHQTPQLEPPAQHMRRPAPMSHTINANNALPHNAWVSQGSTAVFPGQVVSVERFGRPRLAKIPSETRMATSISTAKVGNFSSKSDLASMRCLSASDVSDIGRYPGRLSNC